MHGRNWDRPGMVNKNWLQAHLGPGEHHALRSDSDHEPLWLQEELQTQGSAIVCRAWRKHCQLQVDTQTTQQLSCPSAPVIASPIMSSAWGCRWTRR